MKSILASAAFILALIVAGHTLLLPSPESDSRPF